MKKENPDHVLAIVKATLSAVPCIGGPLASLVGDYIPTATEKSKARAFDLLRQQVEALGDRIDIEVVNKDDFAELFKTCYLAIVRSHRESKLKASTAIIANLLLRDGDPCKLTFTELDHFSRCVEALSNGAVEVLGKVVEGKPTDFGDLKTMFPEHSSDLLMALVSELEKANLLQCMVPEIKLEAYSNYGLRLTPLGERFVGRLLKE